MRRLKYSQEIKTYPDCYLFRMSAHGRRPTGLPGGNSEWEPPDPIPNSEVKTLSADGSVGSPHVRVGHRQALNMKSRYRKVAAFFMAHGEPPR